MLVRDWSSLKMESGQHLVSGWIRFQRTTIFGIQAVGEWASLQGSNQLEGTCLCIQRRFRFSALLFRSGADGRQHVTKTNPKMFFCVFFALPHLLLTKQKAAPLVLDVLF